MKLGAKLLLLGVLLACLPGCRAAEPEAVLPPQKNNSQELGTQPPEKSSETAGGVTAPSRASVRITSESGETLADDGASLLTTEFSKATIRLPDAPEAEQAINEALEAEYEAWRDCNGLLQQARDHKAEIATYGERWFPYWMRISMSPMRVDDEVISFCEGMSLFTGGAHPLNGFTYVCFDARTGAELSLADLSHDPAAFRTVLTSQMMTQAEAMGIVNLLQGRMGDGLEAALEDLLDRPCWYLGLTDFMVSYGDYPSTPRFFVIPYDALSEVLDPRFLPPEPPTKPGQLRYASAGETRTLDEALVLDETGRTFTLVADGPVGGLRVSRLVSWDGVEFHEGQTLYACGRFGPEDSLTLTDLIPEGMPNLAISCLGPDGREHTYAVCESGEDGSLLLRDLTDSMAPKAP